jgi:Phytanoyl-CoA dioxygenase (PhyH)
MKNCLQVFCGGLVLVMAILTGVVLHLSSAPSDVQIHLDLTTTNELLLGSSVSPLMPGQVEEYHRNGVILVRGLLSPQEAIQLKRAANAANEKLFSVFGLFPGSLYKHLMFDLWRTNPEIASLSLQALPKVAAPLMASPPPQTKEQSDGAATDGGRPAAETAAASPTVATPPFRLLRDAFFEYAPPSGGCGWHVDDAGFWPSAEDTAGPTVWIALDPSSIREGGGLAVLNRTAFRQTEPLELTEEYCREAIAGATCDMAGKSPECAAKMDASRLEFDMAPGDAIVWDRWTYHRGVAGTDAFPPNAVKQRYSVRYIPHGATAFGAVHKSVKQGEVFDSPYYPQVWPHLLESEMKALEHGLDQDVTLVGVLQFMAERLAKKVAPFLFPEGADGSKAFSKRGTKLA